MAKTALITGVTGQDGAYLLRLLIQKGYEVHAVKRRTSTFPTARIDEFYNDLNVRTRQLIIHHGDIRDGTALAKVIYEVEPDEVYNLAAQSHVQVSFENPVATVLDNVAGVIGILESIRHLKKDVRFYQASSSEMFGSTPPPQNEQSPFHPRSPYACSKVYGFHQVVNYREAYNLFACNGILFNHESPLRGEPFVTRKITRAVGRIKVGMQDSLELGNLEAKRDWGFAGEYVEAMWRMLQADAPDDYVIATGEMHSVREFCDAAFNCVGLNYEEYVQQNPMYMRASEVQALCGDASKARSVLGWEPRVRFNELVKLMVDADLRLAEEEKKIGRCISMF